MHQLLLREHAHVHAWLTSDDRYTLVGEPLAWCLQVLGYSPHIGVMNGSPVSVIFESHEDLISFTLTWCEPIPNPQVTIPLQNRVMPTWMANNITGVSPLTAPVQAWRQSLFNNVIDEA